MALPMATPKSTSYWSDGTTTIPIEEADPDDKGDFPDPCAKHHTLWDDDEDDGNAVTFGETRW